MHYQAYTPHPLLKPYIQCFWTAERDFQTSNGRLDILPDSYIDLIFNFGSDCDYDDGSASSNDLPSAYIVPLLDKPMRLYSDGRLKSIGVRFFAWGFHSLVDTPIYTKRVVYPLDDTWSSIKQRVQAFVNKGNFAHAVQHLQQHLIEQLLVTNLDYQNLAQASEHLYDSRGMISIESLAESIYLSRRQLERQFQTIVGFSPKTIARTIRFQYVRDAISQFPERELTGLAHEFGYSDQAHLSRDFKHFSDRSPTQFISEIQQKPNAMRFGVAFPD